MKRLSRIAAAALTLAAAASAALLLRPKDPAFNVLILGWDGARLERIEQLLRQKKLPFLQSVIERGSFTKVRVTNGRTDTKSGWAQNFTGYDASVTGVFSNRDYQPIPAGYTIFERLKGKYGKSLHAIFISGKTTNIGNRGPHRICANCKSRFADTRGKTKWWDEFSEAPPKDGGQKIFAERLGEPFHFAARAMTVYKNGLGDASHVAAAAIEVLRGLNGQNFFAFAHFEEPDEQGHLYREGSTQYLNAIQEADRQSRELAAAAEAASTVPLYIFIVSDHGFNRLQRSHSDAPDTFLATSLKGWAVEADRRDFTPSLLRLYAFALDKIEPPLNGRNQRP